MVAALIAALAIASCGEEEEAVVEGSPEQGAINQAVSTSFTNPNPDNCTKVRTQNFNEQSTFETGAAATASCRKEQGDNLATTVVVSNIGVQGASATAEVALTGGGLDGQTVELGLVKEGNRWKVDELVAFIRFDREALNAAVARETRNDPQTSPRLARCVEREFRALGDDQAKDLLINGDEQKFSETFGACIGA